MMTLLRILKWLTGGGLGRLTDLITALWDIFREISGLLGIDTNPDPKTKRGQIHSEIETIRASKEKQV